MAHRSTRLTVALDLPRKQCARCGAVATHWDGLLHLCYRCHLPPPKPPEVSDVRPDRRRRNGK